MKGALGFIIALCGTLAVLCALPVLVIFGAIVYAIFSTFF